MEICNRKTKNTATIAEKLNEIKDLRTGKKEDGLTRKQVEMTEKKIIKLNKEIAKLQVERDEITFEEIRCTAEILNKQGKRLTAEQTEALNGKITNRGVNTSNYDRGGKEKAKPGADKLNNSNLRY